VTHPLPVPHFDQPEAELQARFEQLQRKLVPLWQTISSFTNHPQTIVVVPSISLDVIVHGAELQAYEERSLFLLLLLRQPRARMIYVTSQPIAPHVIDYYLGLLPGIIISHARARLHLVSPNDGDTIPLTVKLLQRPRLLEQIRSLVPDPDHAHLVPFNTTVRERDLALRLGIPMYGSDPKHDHFGTKSGGRKLFAACGVPHPVGFEDVRSFDEVVEAVRDLTRQHPGARSAMVKHDAGVSGQGNGVIDLSGLDARPSAEAVAQRVRDVTLESDELDFDTYFERLTTHGGIVEERLIGRTVRSPSVQLRVTPLGRAELLSTHDQLLGGPSGQSYLGARFPAADAYASTIARAGQTIGDRLTAEGVLGRFAVDFLSVETDDGWRSYAIEINLRKGGTTHPFLTLQFLTDGHYDWARNEFLTARGQRKFFVASDHIESPLYRVLTVDDVFDIAVRHDLHFDHVRQKGLIFHRLAALGDRGRFGLTAVGDTAEEADEVYGTAGEVFDSEAAEAARDRGLPNAP
jgi:hypothetical protein